MSHLPGAEGSKINIKKGGAKPNTIRLALFDPPSWTEIVMEDATFIYLNRSDDRFYDASTGQMRGGPDKVIVYINGVLCTMDRDAKIMIPVSRWKLAEIGLACFMAALRRKGTVTRPVKPVAISVEPVPIPELPSQALPEPLPEATERANAETEWERLMREMRDLSR